MATHDIYLVIPCIIYAENQLVRDSSSFFETAKKHYDEIASIVLYEEYADKIHRESLGSFDLRFTGESTFQAAAIKTKWHPPGEGDKNTNYCTLTIVLKELNVDILDILNSITKREIFVARKQSHNDFENIKDWLIKSGLAQAAPIKSVIFTSEMPSKGRINYILAAEKGNPETSPLSSRYINKCSANNIAQYSSAAVYASDNVVLEIPTPFKPEFDDRLRGELATLFVVELHAQRLAFLSHLNQELEVARRNPEKVDSEKLTAISSDLLNATRLWDTDIYRYILARSFSDEIGGAFKVEDSLLKLSSAKNMFDQLISIIKLNRDEKESKKSAKENKKITMLLNSLALIQATQFIYQVLIYIYSLGSGANMDKPSMYGVYVGVTSFLLMVFLVGFYYLLPWLISNRLTYKSPSQE